MDKLRFICELPLKLVSTKGCAKENLGDSDTRDQTIDVNHLSKNVLPETTNSTSEYEEAFIIIEIDLQLSLITTMTQADLEARSEASSDWLCTPRRLSVFLFNVFVHENFTNGEKPLCFNSSAQMVHGGSASVRIYNGLKSGHDQAQQYIMLTSFSEPNNAKMDAQTVSELVLKISNERLVRISKGICLPRS